MNRVMDGLTRNTPPQIVAIAKSLHDDDIDPTPQIAALRERRTKLETDRIAAAQAYEAHRAVVADLRAKIPDVERVIHKLRSDRVSVTAKALLGNTSISAVDKAEHALQTAERELERINVALPVLDVEVDQLRSSLRTLGEQRNRIDEELETSVLAAKIALVRQRPGN